jgi:hypothetical protein
MAVCAAYQIPHSHFLGGPLRWSAADREKAIWWHLREQERCGSCGTRRIEWDESRHAYSAKKVRCRGCELKEGAEKSITKADGKGVRIELHRTPPQRPKGADGGRSGPADGRGRG